MDKVEFRAYNKIDKSYIKHAERLNSFGFMIDI